MIQLQGRYAWVQYEGAERLLHVEREEPGDVRTMPQGGWIAFAQATRSEAQMDYDGMRYPPDRIIEELESRGVPYQFDQKLAIVLVSVSHFQTFMRPLVLDSATLTETTRSQLLTDRKDRLKPKSKEPRVTKVKKHSERAEKITPTLAEKPIPPPVFSVHPGASIDSWGPMMQAGMIHEAFRALSFCWHDCNLDAPSQAEYRILNVLHQDKAFFVTNKQSWPKTNCRILIASNAPSATPSAIRDRWSIPAESNFLIVDNYLYRTVRQITLLMLTETQVPFFRSGVAPQTMALVKKARGDLHQKGSRAPAQDALQPAIASDDCFASPKILPPFGDWQNNPAVVSWLAS